MKFAELQEKFESQDHILFKLYSLEYYIEKKDDYVIAYAIDYPERKMKYKNFKEAINNYKVYSETLINQIDKIELNNKGDE